MLIDGGSSKKVKKVLIINLNYFHPLRANSSECFLLLDFFFFFSLVNRALFVPLLSDALLSDRKRDRIVSSPSSFSCPSKRIVSTFPLDAITSFDERFFDFLEFFEFQSRNLFLFFVSLIFSLLTLSTFNLSTLFNLLLLLPVILILSCGHRRSCRCRRWQNISVFVTVSNSRRLFLEQSV